MRRSLDNIHHLNSLSTWEYIFKMLLQKIIPSYIIISCYLLMKGVHLCPNEWINGSKYKCFKFINEPNSYFNSIAYCDSLNSTLASINSLDDLNLLINLTALHNHNNHVIYWSEGIHLDSHLYLSSKCPHDNKFIKTCLSVIVNNKTLTPCSRDCNESNNYICQKYDLYVATFDDDFKNKDKRSSNVTLIYSENNNYINDEINFTNVYLTEAIDISSTTSTTILLSSDINFTIFAEGLNENSDTTNNINYMTDRETSYQTENYSTNIFTTDVYTSLSDNSSTTMSSDNTSTEILTPDSNIVLTTGSIIIDMLTTINPIPFATNASYTFSDYDFNTTNPVPITNTTFLSTLTDNIATVATISTLNNLTTVITTATTTNTNITINSTIHATNADTHYSTINNTSLCKPCYYGDHDWFKIIKKLFHDPLVQISFGMIISVFILVIVLLIIFIKYKQSRDAYTSPRKSESFFCLNTINNNIGDKQIPSDKIRTRMDDKGFL